MKAKEFIQEIFGDASSVVMVRGKKRNFFPTDRTFRSIDNGKGEYYACISTTDGTVENELPRRRRENLTAVYAMIFDDIGTKCTAPPIEPAWIIETSPGNFQWGILLVPTSNFDMFESLVDQCAENGWTDKGARGAYRVCRVPGSKNLKAEHNGFTAKVHTFDRDATRWELSDLAEQLGLEFKVTKQSRQRTAAVAAVDLGDGYVDPVLKWLADTGLIVGSADGEWVEIACPWHLEAQTQGGHQTGTTAFYSPAGRGRDRYWWMRTFKCHHNHPERELVAPKSSEFLEWVRAQGGPSAGRNASVELLGHRFCFIEANSQVGDMEATAASPLPLSRWSDFKNRHAQVYAMVGPRELIISREWLKSSKTTRLDTVGYYPGQPRVVGNSYNAWGAPEHAAVDGDPGEFYRHVRHVLPDHWSLFLDWLAFKLQNPASRSYALILVADSHDGNTFGIGRSMIGDVIYRLFQAGVPNLELHELLGDGSQNQFNEWAGNAQIVVVEETREISSDWRETTDHFEKLKKLVDVKPTPNVRVKRKYGGISTVNLYANFLFFTNHFDALRIPSDDRRFAVLPNATHKRAPAEYAAMAAFIENDDAIAALYHWLMQRDVSKFDAQTAPWTPEKDRMQDLAQTEPEVILNEVLETFDGDLLTKRQLKERVDEVFIDEDHPERMLSVVQGMAGKYFRSLPKLKPDDAKNGGRMVVNGRQQPIRCLRNVGRWQLDAGGSPDHLYHAEVKKNRKGGHKVKPV